MNKQSISELNNTEDLSPFHQGEQALQSKAGVREQTETIGKRIVRPYMPDQHREFYTQLPFLMVGSVDDDGWPWASILPGNVGAVHSPTPTSLRIHSKIIKGDPLNESYHRENAAIGLLGIELHTRRRNRVNGFINRGDNGSIDFEVGQSFGNCPQYIQHRHFKYIRNANQQGADYAQQTFSHLDKSACSFIEKADSFYVASAVKTTSQVIREGVDVSHRGGRPGFVKVAGNTLTIPDYPGNNIFNTFGNFLLNPKAGLLFVDFATGELLMLTGTVQLFWDKSEDLDDFAGAQRSWEFTLEQGMRIKDALPFRASVGDYSPNTLMTGTWQEAALLTEQRQKKHDWRSFVIVKTVDESSEIRSFYLQSSDNQPLLSFKAGQHILVKVPHSGDEKPLIRAYSISSAPNGKYYRISVKRENNNGVSQYLHQQLKQGDSVEVKAPRGSFYIDPNQMRPAVLIGAGVGVTPMIAMATHIYNESIRLRQQRFITIIQASKTTHSRAFSQEFKQLEQHSHGEIRYVSYVSKALAGQRLGVDFNGVGRLSANVYRQILALDDYDFFLCGPPRFMQSQYDNLLSLGVQDNRIFAEAFGPAALNRQTLGSALMVENSAIEKVAEARHSLVKFSLSKVEQQWQRGDKTLLETAEEQGLTPEFSCRNGSCGACATRLLSGRISYKTIPTASRADNEVLICCAVPAKGSSEIVLKL